MIVAFSKFFRVLKNRDNMKPRIDKYGFTTYNDIMRFTDEVFRPIEECLQNNLYRECVLQINSKTYEYSVCKSSEAIPGYDVYLILVICLIDI